MRQHWKFDGESYKSYSNRFDGRMTFDE